MVQVILGIDPGFSGGFAALDIYTQKIVSLIPMPIRKTNFENVPPFDNKRVRKEIEGKQIFSWLQKFKGKDTQILGAAIEAVSASPQMGVTSAFRFGEGYGLVKGLLAGLGIKTYLVYPSVWKLNMGLTSNKNQSLAKASELFPEHKSVFSLKKNDGLAEAALLAYYGLRFIKHKGDPSNGNNATIP